MLVRPFTLRQGRPRPIAKAPRRAPRVSVALPSISVVMPSFNQGGFIEDSILSVLSQDYPALEFVIRDGASSDGTLAIIERHGERLAGWTSEPDGGQAAALNSGFVQTTGDIMGWLNSDDLLLPQSLTTIGTYFAEHPNVDVVYGGRLVIDEDGRRIGRWAMPPNSHEYLDWADYIPQETLYWRRSMWEAVGGSLDPTMRFALDWDLLLRFVDAGAGFACLPQYLGAFRVHAASKTVGQIDGVGSDEMARLRALRHGRPVTESEVHAALRPLFARAWAVRLRQWPPG
jgi:GT2 family glycosyltransferase